jgi:hypothetical protein
MSDSVRAQELAYKHWEFISDLLEAHNVEFNIIEIIEFHWLSSFMHGYKHGQEDLQEARYEWQPSTDSTISSIKSTHQVRDMESSDGLSPACIVME